MVGNTTSPEAKSNTDSSIQSRLARNELVAGRTTVEARSLSHLSIVLGRDRPKIVAVSLLFALDAIHGFCLCHEHREVFSSFKQFLGFPIHWTWIHKPIPNLPEYILPLLLLFEPNGVKSAVARPTANPTTKIPAAINNCVIRSPNFQGKVSDFRTSSLCALQIQV